MFNEPDDVRLKQEIFCLPCNLDNDENINSARMNFTIPRSKDILCSIVNTYASVRKDESSILNKKVIYDRAKSNIDQMAKTSFKIDGVDLTDKSKRVMSGFFDIDDREAIADGFWYHIPARTLSPGTHTIERSCYSKMGKFASTNYNITIT